MFLKKIENEKNKIKSRDIITINDKNNIITK